MTTKLMLLIGCLFATTFHPIHVSVTEVDYSKDEKSLQVAHKVFIDDFEKRLEELYQVELEIGLAKEHSNCNQFIMKYLNDHFEMMVNGKQLKGNWVGKEIEGPAIWVYMEYPDIKKVKSIKVENRILLETFNDQKNLVHFNYNGDEKSLILQEKEEIGEVVFN